MFIKLKDWVFNLDQIDAVTVYGKTIYVYCTNSASAYEVKYNSEEESKDVFQKMLNFAKIFRPN